MRAARVYTGVFAGSVGRWKAQERHTQTILRSRVLKQDQMLQNYSVLLSHKPDPLRLPLPRPQTTRQVRFFPNSRALSSAVNSPGLPAHLEPTPAEARLLHLPATPLVCTSPQNTQSKAPLCHPSSAFHGFFTNLTSTSLNSLFSLNVSRH